MTTTSEIVTTVEYGVQFPNGSIKWGELTPSKLPLDTFDAQQEYLTLYNERLDEVGITFEDSQDSLVFLQRTIRVKTTTTVGDPEPVVVEQPEEKPEQEPETEPTSDEE